MRVRDRLQIILITYNRAKFVQRTFERFFYEGSPVYDYDFLVLDNNSSDNTADIVRKFAKTHPNVRYSKNRYNLGISGNIAKAMEIAEKDYVWIIGDDDKFDFSNWNEVEEAISNNEKVICIARYAVPEEYKNSPAYQLFQLTFITGGIYSTSLFSDTTIKNAFDSVYTLFSHIPPVISHLNNGGKIYTVNKAISDNGMNIEETDVSYVRGYKNVTELYDRTVRMSWILGYANVISLLRDKKLKQECIEVSVPYKDIYGNWENFYSCIKSQYIDSGRINYFLEIYDVLPEEHQKYFISNAFLLLRDYQRKIDCLLKKLNCPTFLQQIFSVRNGGNHKVLRILGLKIKFRREVQ